MPTVTLEYVGPLAPPGGVKRREVKLGDGADVEELLRTAGHGDHELDRLGVLVNGRRAELMTLLDDGDEVVLTVLAGGG